MTHLHEQLVQSIADELRSGQVVVCINQPHSVIDLHDFICGHNEYCERLGQINMSASLSPQDAQGTQYKLDRLFDDAAYEYAESIADDVAEYRLSMDRDAVEGGYDEVCRSPIFYVQQIGRAKRARQAPNE